MSRTSTGWPGVMNRAGEREEPLVVLPGFIRRDKPTTNAERTLISLHDALTKPAPVGDNAHDARPAGIARATSLPGLGVRFESAVPSMDAVAEILRLVAPSARGVVTVTASPTGAGFVMADGGMLVALRHDDHHLSFSQRTWRLPTTFATPKAQIDLAIATRGLLTSAHSGAHMTLAASLEHQGSIALGASANPMFLRGDMILAGGARTDRAIAAARAVRRSLHHDIRQAAKDIAKEPPMRAPGSDGDVRHWSNRLPFQNWTAEDALDLRAWLEALMTAIDGVESRRKGQPFTIDAKGALASIVAKTTPGGCAEIRISGAMEYSVAQPLQRVVNAALRKEIRALAWIGVFEQKSRSEGLDACVISDTRANPQPSAHERALAMKRFGRVRQAIAGIDLYEA